MWQSRTTDIRGTQFSVKSSGTGECQSKDTFNTPETNQVTRELRWRDQKHPYCKSAGHERFCWMIPSIPLSLFPLVLARIYSWPDRRPDDYRTLKSTYYLLQQQRTPRNTAWFTSPQWWILLFGLNSRSNEWFSEFSVTWQRALYTPHTANLLHGLNRHRLDSLCIDHERKEISITPLAASRDRKETGIRV